MAPQVPDSRFSRLLLRSLSAAILVPVALLAVYLGGYWLGGLLLVVGVLMAREWMGLFPGFRHDSNREEAGAGKAGVGAFPVLFYSAIVAVCLLALFQHFVAALLIAAATAGLAAALAGRLPPYDRLLFGAGPLYIGVPLVALFWISVQPEYGRDTVFWVLAVIWLTDSGAYAVGKQVGGARLAPYISPNKTWAGLAGGMLLVALAAGAFAVLEGALSVSRFVILSVAVSLLSQLGDLVESAVKRHLGVKDSGTLIPGHGGLFDRLDGLLVVLPVVALCYYALGGSILWR